jgi:hypothetical protein
MAVPITSSLELKLDRLKIHNPPSKQNANDKTAPIRANVFMVVFWFDTLSLPIKITGRRCRRALAANPASKEPEASELKRLTAVRVHRLRRRHCESLSVTHFFM